MRAILLHLSHIPSYKKTETVSVFHHPYDWFDSRYVKDFKDLIQSNSNIIITGHEHDMFDIREKDKFERGMY